MSLRQLALILYKTAITATKFTERQKAIQNPILCTNADIPDLH